MSTTNQPVPAGPARKRRRAAVALKAATKKAGWTEETQLMFLSHFTVERKAAAGIELDPAQLTASSRWFAGQIGWSLSTPIALLCQGIDDEGSNDLFEAFLVREVKLYLEDMAAHGEQPPPATDVEPPPESTESDQHLVVPAAAFDKAMAILSLTDPIPGTDVGQVLMRWVCDFPRELTAHIEVCNGDPPYLDAYLVRTVNDFRTTVCALAIVATLEQTFTFQYDRSVYRVTFHRG